MSKVLLSSLLLLSGCRPDLDDRTSIVDAPRVLAVRAVPADAKPGETVTLTALVADPNGTVQDAPLAWSRCDERKPLAEPGTVASVCIDGSAVVPFGFGPSAQVVVPPDVCRLFGPDRPEPKPGEPAGRAADADATGGYYQPLRIAFGSDVSLFDLRLRCGLAGATQEQLAEYTAKSTPNANPSIVGWEEERVVTRGVPLEWRVRFSLAESYPFFDPVARTLVTRREQLRVSWYATGGTFAAARTGEDPAGESANTWTPPSTAGDVVLWIVVRDDRGGVDFRSAKVTVR